MITLVKFQNWWILLRCKKEKGLNIELCNFFIYKGENIILNYFANTVICHIAFLSRSSIPAVKMRINPESLCSMHKHSCDSICFPSILTEIQSTYIKWELLKEHASKYWALHGKSIMFVNCQHFKGSMLLMEVDFKFMGVYVFSQILNTNSITNIRKDTCKNFFDINIFFSRSLENG